MIDLTGCIDLDDVPLCPLCDQPIFNYEDSIDITAGGVKAMAHLGCTQEELNSAD
ncbi:hypothetical protein [Marinobacter sp. JSM 1782161]|uniref:hypothetical protein n=1 Tax=Marinobacter sp. JSM 1782161 TaxID=2685906 RepID=UPI0014040F53|nr:hypothetical protein [Marinobacter sp. JSM 1782161]